MRLRAIVLALAALFAASSLASAQQQTGEIFGKVTDRFGRGTAGGHGHADGTEPAAAIDGRHQRDRHLSVPRLEIGTYTVKFELAGFKTVVNQDIFVNVGFSAQINAQLGVSTVQETITVTGASPIVDTRNTGTKQTFTNELLQGIPSARDPWVILQQTAGIAMDRENIGGNMSGQQSGYVSRGAASFNDKWSLDGVDITDMAVTGSSPNYYDFDAFEEMTINTGGVDVTQQTGGVGINLVTKSGTDRFRGSSRFYDHERHVRSEQHHRRAAQAGRDVGQPDSGHPGLRRRNRRAAQEGQGVDLGRLRQAAHRRRRPRLLSAERGLPGVQELGDGARLVDRRRQQLPEHGRDAAAEHEPEGRSSAVQGQQAVGLQQLLQEGPQRARRERPEPDRNDNAAGRAVPTTGRQRWWTTGPNADLQGGDQWVLSDRLLLDVQWAHVGNNFTLDFHDPALATCSRRSSSRPA